MAERRAEEERKTSLPENLKSKRNLSKAHLSHGLTNFTPPPAVTGSRMDAQPSRSGRTNESHTVDDQQLAQLFQGWAGLEEEADLTHQLAPKHFSQALSLKNPELPPVALTHSSSMPASASPHSNQSSCRDNTTAATSSSRDKSDIDPTDTSTTDCSTVAVIEEPTPTEGVAPGPLLPEEVFVLPRAVTKQRPLATDSSCPTSVSFSTSMVVGAKTSQDQPSKEPITMVPPEIPLMEMLEKKTDSSKVEQEESLASLIAKEEKQRAEARSRRKEGKTNNKIVLCVPSQTQQTTLETTLAYVLEDPAGLRGPDFVLYLLACKPRDGNADLSKDILR